MRKPSIVVLSMLAGALLCFAAMQGVAWWSGRTVPTVSQQNASPAVAAPSAQDQSEKPAVAKEPASPDAQSGAAPEAAESMGMEFASFQSRENVEFLFSTGLVVQDLLSSDAMVFGPNE